MTDGLSHTVYGWARASVAEPRERDMLWLKIPESHIYTWDGDGWERLQPPERKPMAVKDLPHG